MEQYTIKLAYPEINGKQPKEISIEGKDLYYAELCNLDGVQCASNTELVKEKCGEVVKLIREIDKLNNVNPF